MPRPSRDKDRIVCRHCGREYRTITGPHLRRRHAYAGEHPVYDYLRRFRRQRNGLYEAARLRFDGKWQNALLAAGLNPADYRLRRGRWTTAKAAAWVKRRIAQGRSLLSRDAPRDLLKFVRLNFHKSWTDFVESFGIPYPGIKKRLNYWTRETVLEEIRGWREEGHPTNYITMEREYKALVHQARNHFGTWDAARTAAGIEAERLR